jgi:phage recombination protein Bet
MSANVTAVAEYTPERVELVRRMVAPGVTNDELQFFLYQCKRTGLDPLARQIHAVRRKGKMVIQTGIDGYRLVADRTGTYAGSDAAEFSGSGTLVGREGKEHPLIARVRVWKMVGGARCGFTAEARWDEYYPGEGDEGFFWRKMPFGQLAKCAEALALRKAFPLELSGVYTHEEMHQAGAEDQPALPAPEGDADEGPHRESEVCSQEELKDIADAATQDGGSVAGLCKRLGIDRLDDLPRWRKEEAYRLIELRKRKVEKARQQAGA